MQGFHKFFNVVTDPRYILNMVKFDNIRPPQADPPKIGNSKQRTITLDELYVNATRVDNYCVYSTYITGTCCIMGHPFLLDK